MATATKPRQVHKAQRHTPSVIGQVTCDLLCNGKYITHSTQTYRGTIEREGARKSAQEWAEHTPNARAVDHHFEDGKQRHDAFCEPGRTGDGKPADGGWEFETCADPYHYQGADYTAPSLQ